MRKPKEGEESVQGRKLVLWASAAISVVALAALTAGVAAAKPSKPSATVSKVAIITDTAGLNDKSFNHLANLGRLRAQRVLKLQTRVFISTTSSDYLPNHIAAGQQGYQAVVANGFLLDDALNTAAQQYPNVKWAIVDFPWVALKDKPKNAVGLTFKSEESGYLVGYLAGLLAKKKGGKQVLSAVGGKKIPSVDNWIAGYRAGARRANRRIKVLIDYSGDFPPSFAPKCKEIALNHIAQGAQAVFQVAGGCGLGALQAAKEKKVWGIGVDADQGYLGKHILTSGVKRVDNAVYNFFRQAKAGTLKTGRDLVFNLKNGGQAVGKISTNCRCKAEVAKMNKLKPLIISGKIKPPSKL
jgi:basic membrane protein A and related proteins